MNLIMSAKSLEKCINIQIFSTCLYTFSQVFCRVVFFLNYLWIFLSCDQSTCRMRLREPTILTCFFFLFFFLFIQVLFSFLLWFDLICCGLYICDCPCRFVLPALHNPSFFLSFVFFFEQCFMFYVYVYKGEGAHIIHT